jgi:putative Holliday junction resolvase
MIFDNYKDFPRFGRIVGLDWGLRRCGVAVSDEKRSFVFARPQIDVKNQSGLVDDVMAIITQENAVGIVIGLPLYPDGQDSETTQYVRDFANNLAAKTDLPIVFVEENLTSVMAQQEMGKTSVAKIKRELDSRSAVVILENAISLLKRV